MEFPVLQSFDAFLISNNFLVTWKGGSTDLLNLSFLITIINLTSLSVLYVDEAEDGCSRVIRAVMEVDCWPTLLKTFFWQ